MLRVILITAALLLSTPAIAKDNGQKDKMDKCSQEINKQIYKSLAEVYLEGVKRSRSKKMTRPEWNQMVKTWENDYVEPIKKKVGYAAKAIAVAPRFPSQANDYLVLCITSKGVGE